MAFDRLSPIGPERADWHAALIAVTLANAWRGKGQRAYRLEEFLPQFGPKRPQRSAAELEMMMRDWARGHNQRVRKEKVKHRGNNRKTCRQRDRAD